MSIPILIGLAVALAIVAFAAAILGIGGGAAYTPLQVIAGVEIHTAAATSLLLIAVLSLSATRVYRRARRIDWGMALVFETATVIGGFLGGYGSHLIPSRPLTILLIAAITFSGILMLKGRLYTHEIRPRRMRFYHWQRRLGDERYSVNLLLALPLCLIAGIIAGLVGIGGGILKVPMMALLLGVPIDIAIATSAFMVGLTALGGFAGHLSAGHVDWRSAAVLAPTVFIGAQIGAHCMLRIPKGRLKRIFGIAMLVIAAGLAWKVLK